LVKRFRLWLSTCPECEELKKQLAFSQTLAQTLADKITYRPGPPAPEVTEEPKVPKHKKGLTWAQTRQKLESLTNK
jgi:hypothetical protein